MLHPAAEGAGPDLSLHRPRPVHGASTSRTAWPSCIWARWSEITRSEELYSHPLHPYTQALLSAIPIPDPLIEAQRESKRIHLEGEVTSPIDPAPGCRFASRCPYATAHCKEATPTLKEVGNGHEVACFRVTGE